MRKEIQKYCKLKDGWTALVNLTYDSETLEVLHEEATCTHEDVDYEARYKALKRASNPS